MEIVVALLFLAAGSVVIGESMRLGFGWEADGPEPGYFPFYIALAMMAASLVNLYRALFRGAASPLSRPRPFSRSTVLVPLLIYVGSIAYLGSYAANRHLCRSFNVVFRKLCALEGRPGRQA